MTTPGTFMVDLAALHDAIGQVQGHRDAMQGGIQSVRSTFAGIEGHWQSPAGNTFTGLKTNFKSVTDNLMAVLDDAISRMNTSYNNYVAAEAAATRSLQ